MYVHMCMLSGACSVGCPVCSPTAAGVQSWVASLTEAISNSLGVAQHPTADVGSDSGGVGEEASDAPTPADNPMAPKAERRK